MRILVRFPFDSRSIAPARTIERTPEGGRMFRRTLVLAALAAGVLLVGIQSAAAGNGNVTCTDAFAGTATNVIVPHDPGFEKGCLYIRYGLSSAAPTPERTILGRLYAKDSKVLSWLRPDSELTTIASKPLSVRGRPLVHPIDVYTVRLPELSRPDFKADTTGM